MQQRRAASSDAACELERGTVVRTAGRLGRLHQPACMCHSGTVGLFERVLEEGLAPDRQQQCRLQLPYPACRGPTTEPGPIVSGALPP